MKEENLKTKPVKEKKAETRLFMSHGHEMSHKERNLLREALKSGKKLTIETKAYVEPGFRNEYQAPTGITLTIWEK